MLSDADVAQMFVTGALVLAAISLLLLVYSFVSSWLFLNVLDYLVRKFRL